MEMASIDVSLMTGSMDISANTPLPEFVNFNHRLNCTSCKKLLFSPMQLPCGHRICQDCSDNLKASGKQELTCPSRDEDCEKFSSNNIYPDFSAKREIRQLAVFCLYKDHGCTDTMPWSKLKNHTEKCKFRKKTCPYCKEELNVELYQEHIDKDCQEVICPCPYNCGDVKELKRHELENHKKSCRLKPRQCRYWSIGCKFQATEEKMAVHESDYRYHLEMSIEHSLMLHEEIANLKESLHTATTNVESLRASVSKLVDEKTCLAKQLADLEKEFRLSKDRQREIWQNQSGKLESSAKVIEKVMQDLQLVRVKQNQQDTKILDLEKSGRQRHQTGGITLPEDFRQQFISQDRTIALHDIRLSELDLRCQCLQTANYEGVLIWKIADYHKRKLEAVNGHIMSLYSQPFYTSRYGYKMCGRVYLNGDGIGKGTHLSLFFVVMQGDYDDILPWPFKQKVTLTLLDQKNNRRHLSDTFRPDPNSNSFQKPKSPMNVASGCPLFVAHSVLEDREEQYLHNNTIYIKITVDTSDLLNP